MTRFSEHDERLVTFLRRHRPVPPPPSELEDQVMGAIATASCAAYSLPRGRWRRRLAIPALAASVLLVWGGWHSLQPSPKEESQALATVETFLADTWFGSVYSADDASLAAALAEDDWLLAVYAVPY